MSETPGQGKRNEEAKDFSGFCQHCGFTTPQIEIKTSGPGKVQITACLPCGRVQTVNEADEVKRK